MRTLEEIIEERAKLAKDIKALNDKDNELYRELRDVEKTELKQFEGSCIKIGEDIMYVRNQYLKDDIIELKGIIISVIDEMERLYHESYELKGRGRISLNVIVDKPIEIPLKDFKERTTGEFKDIYEIDYEQFEEERKNICDNFSYNTSLFSWLNMTITHRD